MAMDDYLIGAVAGEMPASFEPEALRAQAVAARTNVLYRMRVSPNPRHPEADICTDPGCCMAYAGEDELREAWAEAYAEYSEKITNAVRSTAGEYAAYGGDEPILALFHASSPGYTEDSANVWGGFLPYLVSVPSPEPEGQAPEQAVSELIPYERFVSAVSSRYPEVRLDGDVSGWMSDIKYTDSGRVSSVKIGGAEASGAELRGLFGLNSAAIEIAIAPEGFIFTTKGKGHGVGMSQYGANAMAKSGADYAEIIRAYYTGVEL
jgi:stage II sporulation protein D